MQFPELFEGPAHTLFLLEGNDLRIVTRMGEETRLSLADFLAFLVHLTAQHAAAFALNQRSERLTSRLASYLSTHRHA